MTVVLFIELHRQNWLAYKITMFHLLHLYQQATNHGTKYVVRWATYMKRYLAKNNEGRNPAQGDLGNPQA